MIRLVITAVHPFAQAHKTAAFAHKKSLPVFFSIKRRNSSLLSPSSDFGIMYPPNSVRKI